MTIVCISQDHTLQENLIKLYGKKDVIFIENTSQLTQTALQSCGVMIVDLKDNKIPRAKKINFPIIALTPVPAFKEAVQLLQYGIRGYGNRKMRQENLSQAVESAKAGQMWLPPAIVTQLITSLEAKKVDQQEDKHNITTLSKRELEVANCVAKGMSNQEMADKMFISLRTVKAHLSSIYSKTGLRNRLELGLYFQEQGLD